MPVLRPDVILLTGDGVDAKSSVMKLEVKGQIENEWDAYEQAVHAIRQACPTSTLLDLPGNHCRFNEPFVGTSQFWLRRRSKMSQDGISLPNGRVVKAKHSDPN